MTNLLNLTHTTAVWRSSRVPPGSGVLCAGPILFLMLRRIFSGSDQWAGASRLPFLPQQLPSPGRSSSGKPVESIRNL